MGYTQTPQQHADLQQLQQQQQHDKHLRPPEIDVILEDIANSEYVDRIHRLRFVFFLAAFVILAAVLFSLGLQHNDIGTGAATLVSRHLILWGSIFLLACLPLALRRFSMFSTIALAMLFIFAEALVDTWGQSMITGYTLMISLIFYFM